jgi:hypothetical protein
VRGTLRSEQWRLRGRSFATPLRTVRSAVSDREAEDAWR